MFSTCTYQTITNSGKDFKIGGQLNTSTLSKLNKCIGSFKNIFVNQWEPEISVTNIGSCFIKSKSIKPISCQSNKLTRRQNEMLTEKMSELLRLGVVQHSSSEWSSNAYVKEVENGELSLFVNYSKLNETLEEMDCSIPSLEEQFERCERFSVFSKIVIKDAFSQIPMNEKDVKKTAFVTELGKFEFNVMPHNLKNADKIFYKLIRKAIGDQNFVKIHSNQILVVAYDLENHLELLKRLFRDLRNANFMIDIKKSCFCVESVEFGGHEISDRGFTIGPDQLEKIRTFPAPKSATEMSMLFNRIKPYTRYVSNYQTLIESLVELTNRKGAFSWNLEAKKSFFQLITSLINAPYLNCLTGSDEIKSKSRILLDENDNCLNECLYESNNACSIDSNSNSNSNSNSDSEA